MSGPPVSEFLQSLCPWEQTAASVEEQTPYSPACDVISHLLLCNPLSRDPAANTQRGDVELQCIKKPGRKLRRGRAVADADFESGSGLAAPGRHPVRVAAAQPSSSSSGPFPEVSACLTMFMEQSICRSWKRRSFPHPAWHSAVHVETRSFHEPPGYPPPLLLS